MICRSFKRHWSCKTGEGFIKLDLYHSLTLIVRIYFTGCEMRMDYCLKSCVAKLTLTCDFLCDSRWSLLPTLSHPLTAMWSVLVLHDNQFMFSDLWPSVMHPLFPFNLAASLCKLTCLIPRQVLSGFELWYIYIMHYAIMSAWPHRWYIVI